MMIGKSDEERKQLQMKFMAANREALLATIGWWMKRMAYGPYPLQEKLTLFWHGHFTTSAKDEKGRRADVDAERASASSCRRELPRVRAAGLARSAMLDYLNNTQNRKAHPNENYARELMELFTLGIGNYTERDIKDPPARSLVGRRWG